MTQDDLVVDRVHAIEYRMPLKRPYGTSRGVTNASTSFVARVVLGSEQGLVVGVGEGQPRRRLTGDVDLETAWGFFQTLGSWLVGQRVAASSPAEVRRSVSSLMRDASDLANEHVPEQYRGRGFRGTLLGVEVALLDGAARSLGISIADVLGRRRGSVEVTVRTLSTQNTEAQFERKVARQLGTYPMVRVKGKGNIRGDITLLELVHRTNLEHGREKPIWIDLNEGLDPEEARSFIDELATRMAKGELPSDVTIEQPIPRTDGGALPTLQRHADEVCSSLDGRIWLMPDESLWDLDDFVKLQADGGCGAMNIKTAKAGGLIASLELAEEAVRQDPNVRIGIGGMVGTSDLTTWSLINLVQALPRIDYLTAVPPSNVQARFTDPLTELTDDSNRLTEPQEPGLGARLDYAELFPYITRAAWFPSSGDANVAELNQYDAKPVRGFTKTQLDSHLLEREALRLGLGTTRFSKVAFLVEDRAGARTAFSWTKSSLSSEVAVAITSDKQSTKLLLEEVDVPVPRGVRLRSGDVPAGLEFAREVGYPVVLKPLRGTGGRDVMAGLTGDDDLRWAFENIAKGRYAGRDVLVEEHIPGASYRVFVADGRVVSFRMSRYGEITGDGERTVGELLLERQLMRMSNPHLMNRPITLNESTLRQIARSGFSIDSIPPMGVAVRYSANTNPQQGGETAEVLDETHPSLIEAAVRAAGAIPGLAFAGVDFLCEDHRLSLDEQAAGICEINAHPAQSSHEYPLMGAPTPVSQAIVTMAVERDGLSVAPTGSKDLSVRVLVSGRLSDRAYMDWFARHARSLGLAGWIRTLDRRSVEAVLSGADAHVAALVSRAIDGPSSVQVSEVRTRPAEEPTSEGFEVIDA